MKRIGMLTSGGDCQALNAAMRGVVKGLSENVDGGGIWFLNGYKGPDLRGLPAADIRGFLRYSDERRTILGSRQPFKQMRVPDANGRLDKVEAMRRPTTSSTWTVW